MPRRVIRKWRPPLAFVLGGTLAAVFFLPLIGIAYFRLAGGVLGWAETSWMIAWMAFVSTAVLGYFLWRLVLRPMKALTAYAKSEGEAVPPEHFGTPEFSELGQAVLQMTATLRGREAVLRSYADHVTHELKSPLSAIRGAAELLEDVNLPPTDRAKLVGNVATAAARIEDLLEDQRALARAYEPMEAGACILSEAVEAWPDVEVLADGMIPLNPKLIEVVLTHLIDNAKRHGATRITAMVAADCLVVADNGSGISDGNRARIFDPFFTTNRDGGGTGMGLAIVQRMLSAHGASIELVDGPVTTFKMRF